MAKSPKKPESRRHFSSRIKPIEWQRPSNANPFDTSAPSSYIPVWWHNAYNEEDLDTFEDMWAHTLAGQVIDTRILYAMGEGIRPTFKLLRPHKVGDEKAQQKELAKYDEYIDELILFDKRPKNDFFRNVFNASVQAKVFGRSALALEPGLDENRKIQETTAVKPIHPRFLGRVYTHNDDWSLSSVQAFLKKKQLIYDEEMIYFVNRRDTPRFRTMWYGYSELQRVAGQSRALREITEVDIIEIVKGMFAGYGIILVDQHDLPDTEKEADLDSIIRNLKPGQFTALTKQGEKGTEFHQFDFKADITGIANIIDKCERMIIGNGQVPGPLLGRETESNMATMYGKIRMFMDGPVRVDRRWIAETVAHKWYERNLQYIAPEILEHVEVVPEFLNLPVNAWTETIDGLMKLRQMIPELPIEEIMRLAGLEHLAPKLEKDGLTSETMRMVGKEAEDKALANKIQSFIGTVPKGKEIGR